MMHSECLFEGVGSDVVGRQAENHTYSFVYKSQTASTPEFSFRAQELRNAHQIYQFLTELKSAIAQPNKTVWKNSS